MGVEVVSRSMSMFSNLKGFCYRHKNKFLIGGALFTGTVIITRYAQKRLRGFLDTETTEFLERNRKRTHFESINRTCDQTIMNLSATMLDKIFDLMNTEQLIDKLKENPDNKLDVWIKLKNLVFSKAACIVYSMVILVVTLKIQLNIVGGYLYRDPTSVSLELQEKYLSLCEYFLNNGIEKLASTIESEVSTVLNGIDFRKQMKLSDLEAIFWSLQSCLDSNSNSPIQHVKTLIFETEPSFSDEVYNNMIRDTADLLESEEVKFLIITQVNSGFVLLGDQLSEFFTQTDSTVAVGTNDQGQDPFQNPFMNKKPLAKIIPILNGILSKLSVPQNFLNHLVRNEKLQMLGANVYESLL